MPFSNLPDEHESRWGESLTAETMKKCVWLKPKVVARLNLWSGQTQTDFGTQWLAR